jgi:hypothetical protein
MAGLGLDGSYSSSDGSEPEEDYTPSKAKPSKKTTELNATSPLKKSPFKQQATEKPVRPIPVNFDSDSDEEADLEASKNSPRGKKRAEAAKLAAKTMRSSAEKARREKSITLSDSEDEIVRPSQPRTLFRPAKSARSSNAPPCITSSQRRGRKSVIVEDSEDDDPIISSSKPSQPSALRNRKLQIDSIGAEEDSEPISPLKRRRPSTYVEDGSDVDLPSPSKVQKKGESTSATTPRTTRQQKKRTHRTEKEKKLELLKRKRAGEKIEELTESESSEDEESNDELQVLEEFDDEESSPDQVRKPAREQRRNTNADDNESDFIVEDDEGPLGIPDYSLQIPLQFTHAAHKPLKDHFRDVIEWMVHKKINPGFSWDDEVYTQAFFKLNHEYSGYAQSKFVSTQWTASFTRALSARPLLYIRGLESEEAINILGEAKCEICNHRKHISTYALKFAGKPYYKENLEDVDQSDGEDSDASSNSDKNEVNSQGIKIPPEEKEYLGGRYVSPHCFLTCSIFRIFSNSTFRICKSNAEQAHTLIHWKWNLNQWVLDNLEAEGYLTPAKIVEREKMKTKQRREYANGIVDKWERDGQIKSLYRDFKGQREVAREAKGSGGSGWSRS